MPKGQLQLVYDSDEHRWSIYRWSMDGDKLLDVIGPFLTKERADRERLHLLAAGGDLLYNPRSTKRET